MTQGSAFLSEGDIKKFRQRLLRWYGRNCRDLPWRRTRDPYRIWVSEVMLQQTQVKTVVPYYERFIKAFPDPEALAAADLNRVLKLWEGLGYYARARNLHRSAGIISSERQGRLPDTLAGLKALPGVGDYVAAAVLSIAFRLPVAAVDGNVKRILARLLLIQAPANTCAGDRTFEEQADRLLHRLKPHIYNQAMMELGALVCRPDRPACEACPVQPLCRAAIEGRVAEFPRRAKRRKVPVYYVAAGVVYRRERFLITRRKPEGLLGGLWEIPGGKVGPKETPAAACRREIREEAGLDVDIVSHLTTVRHAYTHFKIIMDVFICRCASGRVKLCGPVDFRWITGRQLSRFAFPKATLKVLPLLSNGKTA